MMYLIVINDNNLGIKSFYKEHGRYNSTYTSKFEADNMAYFLNLNYGKGYAVVVDA